MGWTERIRRALHNLRAQVVARPLVLPLSIAYTGEEPAAFWRMSEDLLGVLLGAGFARRQAIILVRVVSNLVAGYLLLMRQGAPDLALVDAPAIERMRRQVELTVLGLPVDRFPHSVESAREVAEVWLNDPDLWWQETVDLIVFGLERMLERSRDRAAE